MDIDKIQLPEAIKVRWRKQDQLEVKVDGRVLQLTAELRKDMRKIVAQQIVTTPKKHTRRIIIADFINPVIKEMFQQKKICYLDAAGNLFIYTDGFFILVDGNKPVAQKGSANTERAFAKTGLPIVFDLLQNEKWLEFPYRQLATEYDIALGNLTHVTTSLQNEDFLIKTGNAKSKKYIIQNKKALFDKWIAAYENVLQPKIHLGNFRFINNEAFENWQKLTLPDGAAWGGEAAAAILTNHFLKPGVLTIYTETDKKNIIKHLKLVPDERGNVRLYSKFWKFNEPQEYGATVPPLLIYADLVNTADARNIEIAQTIYHEYIKEQLGELA